MTTDKKLSLKEGEERDACPGTHADSLESMRNYLEIRARAFEMLDIAPYQVYKRLNEKCISKAVGRVPKGMRSPTIEEIRRFDRTLHEELLRRKVLFNMLRSEIRILLSD
eukprot:s3226_g1.t1